MYSWDAASYAGAVPATWWHLVQDVNATVAVYRSAQLVDRDGRPRPGPSLGPSPGAVVGASAAPAAVGHGCMPVTDQRGAGAGGSAL